MRAVRKIELYPKLLRAFGTETELGEAINRSRSYVSNRMSGASEFTFRDKKMLLSHLNEPMEKMRDYFPDEAS